MAVRKPKIVNKSVTIAATATGASATELYTCPTRFVAEVGLLIISNPTAGAINTTVEIYDSKSTNYYKILDTTAVSINGAVSVVSDKSKLYLDEGDKIVVSAATGGSLNAFLSLTEIYSEVTR